MISLRQDKISYVWFTVMYDNVQFGRDNAKLVTIGLRHGMIYGMILDLR